MTGNGRGVREYRPIDTPQRRLESSRELIFISCGQFAQRERDLGKRISELIERHTPYAAYFADNEHTFEGLAKNIIGALHRMAGMVFVMHGRGEVKTPSGQFRRGSVWIEQEIAIAASLQQMGKPISVAGYIEDGIHREGLRDLLHLNPVTFTEDAEVVAHFEELVKSEKFRIIAAQSTAQEPIPLLSAAARMVGPDESRRLGLADSSAIRLLVTITNAGRGSAKDVTVSLEGLVPEAADDRVGFLGPGDHIDRTYYCSGYSAGSVPPGSVPDRIRVRYNGIGWTGGTAALVRTPASHPPIWVLAEATPPVPT